MLLDEIATRLIAQSVGGLPGSTAASTSGTGWTIWSRQLGPTPDQSIAIVPTGGFQREDRAFVDRPTFQIVVRAGKDTSSSLETKVAAVDAALNAFDGTLSSRVYVDINRQGDYLWLGRDENGRPMYSLNYLAHRSRTT